MIPSLNKIKSLPGRLFSTKFYTIATIESLFSSSSLTYQIIIWVAIIQKQVL